jgi:RimJ/RimL family protein N-acetyltransferase
MSEEWLTERLLARAPAPSDETAYLTLFTTPAIGAWLRPAPLAAFTIAEIREMLGADRRHWAEHGYGPWALIERRSGAFLGRGGLRETVVDGEPAVELPWAIDPGHQDRGLATEAALAAIEWARALGLAEVVALTTPDNAASRRVAEKAGLTLDGEVWHHGLDHLAYRLALS